MLLACPSVCLRGLVIHQPDAEDAYANASTEVASAAWDVEQDRVLRFLFFFLVFLLFLFLIFFLM